MFVLFWLHFVVLSEGSANALNSLYPGELLEARSSTIVGLNFKFGIDPNHISPEGTFRVKDEPSQSLHWKGSSALAYKEIQLGAAEIDNIEEMSIEQLV